MKDYIIRATAAKGDVRIFACLTTGICEEARRRHHLHPTSADALGRVLTGAVLMGVTSLKGDDILTLRIMGDGPLGSIIAVSNAKGEVKGYVQNPQVYMPVDEHGKFAFANAIGMGMLYVTKDMGLREPYVGSVPLVSGEIATDISEYYMSSEQTPSSCGLGVLVGKNGEVEVAGGFLLQLIPGASEETIDVLEENIRNIDSITNLLKEGKTPEDLIALITDGLEVTIHEKQDVTFKCECSRGKLRDILKGLGAKELAEILATEGQAEVICHFCGERYLFSGEEITNIIGEIEKKNIN